MLHVTESACFDRQGLNLISRHAVSFSSSPASTQHRHTLSNLGGSHVVITQKHIIIQYLLYSAVPGCTGVSEGTSGVFIGSVIDFHDNPPPYSQSLFLAPALVC